MGKLIWHGWQKSAAGAAQPLTGIILGSRILTEEEKKRRREERKRAEREREEQEFYDRFGDGPVAFSIGPRRSKAKNPERP
jgi:hypothetical protein